MNLAIEQKTYFCPLVFNKSIYSISFVFKCFYHLNNLTLLSFTMSELISIFLIFASSCFSIILFASDQFIYKHVILEM